MTESSEERSNRTPQQVKADLEEALRKRQKPYTVSPTPQLGEEKTRRPYTSSEPVNSPDPWLEKNRTSINTRKPVSKPR